MQATSNGMEEKNKQQNNEENKDKKEDNINWHKKCLNSSCYHCYSGKGSFWGWFFIILGIYFLAKELGIFTDALWPILLIILGVYLLRKKRFRHHSEKDKEKLNVQ